MHMVVGSSMEMSNLSVVISSKKNLSLFSSSHPMLIAPQPGIEPKSIHAGILTGSILYKSCAGNHSHYDYMSAGGCFIKKTAFFLMNEKTPAHPLAFIWILNLGEGVLV